MKENFGIGSLPSIPSSEGGSQQSRFDDLENLNSLTKSSLDLGLWSLFLINTNYIILQSLSFIFTYDNSYCRIFIHYAANLSLFINLQNIWKNKHSSYVNGGLSDSVF